MKKTTAIWLITAACLVLTGGAVFCLTMAANHWDFSLLDTDKPETVTFDIREDFQSISVDSATEDIEFRLSDDGTCSVVCYEREKERHTAAVQNGTLMIERSDSREWYDHISLFSFGSPTITVYLPQTVYDSLTVRGSTGDVCLSEELMFESMDVRVSTGKVDCRASAVGTICVETGTGDIRIDSAYAGELDLSVSTGHVDVRSVACEGGVEISVSTGDAELTDVTCESVVSAGSTGSITMRNVTAVGTIFVRRSTGDVTFDGCDAPEINVETDTGDVTGSLLTEKIFITETDTGDVRVPKTTTGGICEVRTDTGNIRFTIE